MRIPRWAAIACLSLALGALPHAQPASRETFDPDFARSVREWTTSPEFLSPLVDQLPLVKGNPAQVLQHPNSAVISESLARKYFGDADPIGKVVQLDAGPTVQITGVMRDLPTNTHMDVSFVIPMLSKAARMSASRTHLLGRAALSRRNSRSMASWALRPGRKP